MNYGGCSAIFRRFHIVFSVVVVGGFPSLNLNLNVVNACLFARATYFIRLSAYMNKIQRLNRNILQSYIKMWSYSYSFNMQNSSIFTFDS